ncbi:MAG: hypothetical protein LAT78_07640 [Roseinatronobacter sp.]|nr:hypothetical protein [Roseinatronobacter sp.]
MPLVILTPARVIAQALLRDAGYRAKVELAKLALGSVAAGLIVSAALVALAKVMGYPIAAGIIAVILALLALAVHLVGRRLSARQSHRIACAQDKVQADIALAASLAQSALPLLPLLAFVTAFTLARRR